MMQPSDLKLPYPSWSAGQWDALCELTLAADTKYIVCEAPTGSGKSALAVALHRATGAIGNLQVVTGTKQLQDQYANGLGLFKLMGRNNFPCHIEPGTDASGAPCTTGYKCNLAKPGEVIDSATGAKDHTPPGCSYYAQKWHGLRAPESVWNYAYWLAMHNYAEWRKAGLLVLDEAHLLEDEVRRFSTLSLLRRHVQVLVNESIPYVYWPHYTLDFEGWQRWADEIYDIVDTEYKRLPRLAVSREEKRWRAAVTEVHRVCETLVDDTVSNENWVLQETPFGIDFLPVWVHDIAPKVVFSRADRVLLMSATVLSAPMFCQQLGIPAEDVTFVQVPSVFDPSSRPLNILPGVRVQARNEASLKLLVKEVDAILARHPAESGIIHTGSYKIAKYLMEHSRYGPTVAQSSQASTYPERASPIRSRLVTHTSRDRAGVISSFPVHPRAVLVSPSATTGVDLPYDRCRFQIIAKIPFPDTTDPQVAKRMKEVTPGIPNAKGQGWYNWITMCNIIQAYGRGMRAADDSCATYLVDGNWRWFKHAASGLIPKWVSDAIRYEKTGNDMEDYLAQLKA